MNSKKIQLVVSDMDGTLLGTDKLIPPQNIETIRKLQEKNIPVVLCTGRPHFMVNEYLRQLNLETQVIGSNGGFILDVKTKNTIFSSNLEIVSLKKIVDFSMENNIDFLLYDETTVYYTEISKRIEIFHTYNDIAVAGGSERVPCLNVKDHYNDIIAGKKNISKILVTELEKGDLEKMHALLNTLPAVYAVPSMDIVIDIMNGNVSKGNAVKKLSDHLKIPLANVLVVGDHKNDVSMLSIAGYSACLVNGAEEAKKSAQYITKLTNDEAGFSEAISYFEDLGLIE